MNTKLISDKALSVIDQYLYFKYGTATTAIPYFNNRRQQIRGSLRSLIGKGSPKDIYEEVNILLLQAKVPLAQLSGDNLHHFLVDENIGIDCSGFAYYVLDAECSARSKGSIDRKLHFPYNKGILGKLRAKFRPDRNVNVATLAHEKNSIAVKLRDTQPGDMITMIGTATTDIIPNHIVIIHQIEYQNFVPVTLHYTHSKAWPNDGEYNHGVRQGIINITDPNKLISDQDWPEWLANDALGKLKQSKTEIRRLKVFVV